MWTLIWPANDVSGNAFQMYRRNPAPGRWTLSVFTGVVSGQELQQPFTVKVAYNTVKVSAGLPNNARTALTAGQPVQVPVKITNTGVAPQTYFADGRLDAVGDLPLAGLFQADQPIPLPVPADVLPQWLVPTETPKLTFVATASQPVNLDVAAAFGAPELYSAAVGNGATVNVTAAQVTPGIWTANIGQLGPFGDGGAPVGTVSVAATAHGQLFDPNVTSNALGISGRSGSQRPRSTRRRWPGPRPGLRCGPESGAAVAVDTRSVGAATSALVTTAGRRPIQDRSICSPARAPPSPSRSPRMAPRAVWSAATCISTTSTSGYSTATN